MSGNEHREAITERNTRIAALKAELRQTMAEAEEWQWQCRDMQQQIREYEAELRKLRRKRT